MVGWAWFWCHGFGRPLPPRGDARIREREAQRAAEAAEKASEGEEDLDFEEFGIDGLGCNWDHGIVIVVDWGVRICRLGYAGLGSWEEKAWVH